MKEKPFAPLIVSGRSVVTGGGAPVTPSAKWASVEVVALSTHSGHATLSDWLLEVHEGEK